MVDQQLTPRVASAWAEATETYEGTKRMKDLWDLSFVTS
jgi:hypothetical protein